MAVETNEHLLCGCTFDDKIWNWLGALINCSIDHSSMQNLLLVCDRKWSSQVKDVVVAGIINYVRIIWHYRNKLLFNDKLITFQAAINMVIANVSLTGNLSSGHMASSIQDFCILKSFGVNGRPAKDQIIKQVNWFPPLCNWVKCNTDGAAGGATGPAACGGIFKDYRAAFLGCFSIKIGINFSLHAELVECTTYGLNVTCS